MSTLTRHQINETTTDFEEIRRFLAGHQIEFTRWEASMPLSDAADQETILKAYAHEIDPYMLKHGFQSADVITVSSETPNIEAIRQKFLGEHTHSEYEVRYFVDGAGTFYFNLGEEVISVLCERGDFIAVPEGYKHWFDLAPQYRVKAIRIFTGQEGWIAQYTNSGIDQNYVK
jgi:1,2-dihydroxy-3-keto-5-methylthiopentene dioxygenase